MKKRINIFLISLLLISCKEKKTEFIQSNVYSDLFLIKNLPRTDSLLKKEISLFLIKNLVLYKKRENSSVIFYKYTNKTSYFLENEEYEGFESKTLSNNDELGSFIITKCENDTTKLVGELFFDGLKGSENGLNQIDTLIYKCK